MADTGLGAERVNQDNNSQIEASLSGKIPL